MRRSSLSRLAIVLAAGLALAGCNAMTTAMNDAGLTTGSIQSAPANASTDQWRALAEQAAPAYQRNPADPNAAIAYGRALRQSDQVAQAVAVLQTAAIKNTQNMALLGEYGRALAANGDLDQALDVLGRAHTPDEPNWHILMAQGAVLDQMGRSTEAIEHYQTALKIVPGEPSVLSNMGLSYALTNDLPDAERALRQACASPQADSRMRQNLALVLALEGHFAEAQQVSTQDLGATAAAQNITYLKGMLAQSNNWQKLRQSGARANPAG